MYESLNNFGILVKVMKINSRHKRSVYDKKNWKIHICIK